MKFFISALPKNNITICSSALAGPPRLLLHFLVDSEHDVLGRIRDEATFDRIAADLIFDFFDDEDEDFETDAE